MSFSLSLFSGAAAENMLGSLLCLPGTGSVLLDPYGSTISETTSEAWSVEVLPSDSGGGKPGFILLFQCPFVFTLILIGYCLIGLRCAFAFTCVLIYACSIFMFLPYSEEGWGEGTPGVVALHSYQKMCTCICHHICMHLLVFQGRSASASKRQLRVSLEGPPGVFAPVVEQWGGKRKDSSCPQSAYMVSVLYLAPTCTILL